MQIEKENNQFIIRVPENVGLIGLQRILDYIRFSETTSKSTATSHQIDNLSKKSKSDWWKKNKEKFIK
ncbi:hypothetical protein ACH3O9_10395 [Leeuwenhoekiella sp. A16]|uniref:hypothetical protein n=1 Tax=unclassified Leeuwenhoekiella TaxID=2615029 RepID=UPI003A81209D